MVWRWAGTALGIGVCAALLVCTSGLNFLRRPTFDALLRLAATSPPAYPDQMPDVAVVAIDARSMAEMEGRWPWPRSHFAALVRRLDEAGARAIAFDINFSEARDPDEDADFAHAIAESGRVVLSAHREFQTLPGIGQLELASMPHPPFAEGAAAVGLSIVDIDADGVIRTAFRAREIVGHVRPSLADAALDVAIGWAPNDPQAADAEGFRIDYRRSQPPIPQLSIADVLEGRFDEARVAGRIVFVGATAVGFQDLWTTPLGPNRPGVVIQAEATRTLAAESAGESILVRLGRTSESLLVLVLSLLAGAIGLAPYRYRLVGLGGMGLALPLGSLFAVRSAGVLIDPIVPFAVIAVHYTLGLEFVRQHLGARLAERELSLSTLFTVGEATSGPEHGNGLDIALALLADVVAASGVALLRTSEAGELDGARLEWRRRGLEPIGDIDTGTLVLADRQTRIFEGSVPGKAQSDGMAVYTPLFAGTSAVGVLVIEQERASPLSDMQLRTIATVGQQLALSVENLRLLERLQATFQSSIAALASAVEARDGYTDQHCRRLAVFSSLMAERLGLPDEEIEAIQLGALLHDVGKIGIRDDVLLKAARLTQEERKEIEQHTVIGHRIVDPIEGLTQTTVGCVRHHHERWNGTGYPDGLAGEEIPLGARIVAIVDVWDALSTARPYKTAYPQARVREILEKDSGVRYEPTLIDLFFEILDERGEELLDLISQTTGSGSET